MEFHLSDHPPSYQQDNFVPCVLDNHFVPTPCKLVTTICYRKLQDCSKISHYALKGLVTKEPRFFRNCFEKQSLLEIAMMLFYTHP